MWVPAVVTGFAWIRIAYRLYQRRSQVKRGPAFGAGGMLALAGYTLVQMSDAALLGNSVIELVAWISMAAVLVVESLTASKVPVEEVVKEAD